MAEPRKVAEAIILLLAGVALLVLCFILSLNVISRAALGAEAQGEILGFVNETHTRGVDSHPVVAFTDADGNKHRFESDIDATGTDYVVGDKVPVVYAPEKPCNASIKSFSGVWWSPLGTGTLGLLLTWGGAIYTRRRLFQGETYTSTEHTATR